MGQPLFPIFTIPSRAQYSYHLTNTSPGPRGATQSKPYDDSKAILSYPDFVNLHVHSHYSDPVGVAKVSDLLQQAKNMGQMALALTDHGAMYGAIEFYLAAKRLGIKPIIGFEAFVIQDVTPYVSHLTLLARNFEGYQNLCRLCSYGFTRDKDNLYTFPHINKDRLREFSAGVCCLSGCKDGEISKHLVNGKYHNAEEAARWYRGVFGEDGFFLEIMNNGQPKQHSMIISGMRELSNKTGIPLVATSDAHYAMSGGMVLQDLRLSINTNRLLRDGNRMHAQKYRHLKSAEEMLVVLPGYEDAIENTQRVADICNLALPLKDSLPSFLHTTNEVPGIIVYVEKERRQDIVDQLTKRYGHDRVVNIIEFNRLSLRSAVREVGRVMDLSCNQVDKVAEMIPEFPTPSKGVNPLMAVLSNSRELQAEYGIAENKKLLDAANALTGVIRSAAIHPSAVIVSSRPITDFCPLATCNRCWVTQYEEDSLKALGLCSIDIAGLDGLEKVKDLIGNMKSHNDT